MANDQVRAILNRRLLAEARQLGGNVEELLTSAEFRDPDDDDAFLFDINCTDISGNTPLHLAVLSGSIENVNLLIEADGCDVDPPNATGDTPLHLAVQLKDRDARRAIVSALVETAGAIDSIQMTNKAGQTPNALSKIFFPNDTEVISLTTPPSLPARQVSAIIDEDDIASDGDYDGPGSE